MQEYGSTGESTNTLSFFNAILKRWVLIVMVTVLCALAGLAYSLMYVKPTYTASRSVILRLSVGDLQANTVTTDVALSKIYLPDVMEFVGSPAVINRANELLGSEKSVKSGSIAVKYGNKDLDSLIFSISYTDSSAKVAEARLNAVIESVMLVDEEMGVIEAEDFSLIPTQNDTDFSMNNKFSTYVILGVVAGLVISVVLAVILNLADNTVVDKNEFEEVTGVSVLSNINKIKKSKKK